MLSVLLFVNGVLYRVYLQSYINPVTIVSFFWFFFLSFPVIVYPGGYVSASAVFFIVSVIIVFSIPFYFISGKKPNIIDVFSSKFILRLYFILFFLFILSVFCFFIHLSNNGYTLFSWIRDPLSVTGGLVSAKYKGEIAYSLFSRLSVILMYPVGFFSGIVSPNLNRGKWRVLVFCFTTPLLYFLIFGDKGALLLVAFLFYSGWLISKSAFGNRTLLDRKNFLAILFLAVALFILLILAFRSRASGLSFDEFLSFFHRNMISYSSGHLFAFSSWYDSYFWQEPTGPFDNRSLPFGYYTFAAVYDLFGWDRLFPHGGVYDDFYSDGFFKTNIYTVFRGFLLDFGIFATYVFSLCAGFVSALLFRVVRYNGKFFVFGLMGWYSLFVFLYSSYIISSFIWLSTSFSIILVGFLYLLGRLRFNK
ncbi:oligosaccharide repeat unit polymerase [Marinobacter nauticus]|uniref:Oligosaccharide repeat unit polymerase n=2 Tax=Marinobacter nauticus TaxID=2743 RepID=A0A368XVN1_MARNT|nr:oligosaccharide repeat unit polymerase [Marinobacter nauticus]